MLNSNSYANTTSLLGNEVDSCSIASAATTSSDKSQGPGTSNSYCSWFANLGMG